MLERYMNKIVIFLQHVTEIHKIATVTFWQKGHLCAVFDSSL